MSLASGNRASLSYVVEGNTTHGTTPGSPTMKALRAISRNLNFTKALLQSQEVRQDRNPPTIRHGFRQVEGSFGFELSVGAFDDMLQALLGGTWTAYSTSGVNLSATASTKKITRAGGSYVTDGFRPGDLVTVAGFSNSGNNGLKSVSVVGALDLTVIETLIDESAGASKTVTLTGSRLDVGTTLRTFTFERRFTDIAQYQVLTGVALKSADINIQPAAIVGGTMNVVGMNGAALSGTSLGSPTAAATNDPLTAFEGNLYVAGASIGIITGIKFTMNNNRTVIPVVGSTSSPDVFDGSCQITGEITALLQDATILNYFANETALSAWLKMSDINGTDFIRMVIPAFKASGAMIDPPQEGPVSISLPFTAYYDSVSGTSISFQRSNA